MSDRRKRSLKGNTGSLSRARPARASCIRTWGSKGWRSEESRVGKECRYRGDWSSDVCSSDLYVGSAKEIFERKCRQPLASAPGARFVYSDVGFEVLGELVRQVSSLPLEEFARQRVFVPLGMKDTEFRPGGHGRVPLSRIAPTERINGEIRRGAVHDPRAYALGGV